MSNVYEIIPGVDSEVTDGITALFEAARERHRRGFGFTFDHHHARPGNDGDDRAGYNCYHGAPPGHRHIGSQGNDHHRSSTVELSGTLFLDIDGNGVREGSDEPLAAVGVVVTGGDGGSQTVETDLDGNFALAR